MTSFCDRNHLNVWSPLVIRADKKHFNTLNILSNKQGIQQSQHQKLNLLCWIIIKFFPGEKNHYVFQFCFQKRQRSPTFLKPCENSSASPSSVSISRRFYAPLDVVNVHLAITNKWCMFKSDAATTSLVWPLNVTKWTAGDRFHSDAWGNQLHFQWTEE